MSFGPEYARLYEAKYSLKDYREECAMVEQAMGTHGIHPGASVLDIGCGTGGHAFELASRGYRVTGVDRSPSMIERAKGKLGEGARPHFQVADATELNLGREFDAAIMMFAVLSYMETNSQLLACLRSVCEHLRPGGVLLADFWYGPGVLSDPPMERVSHFDVEDGVTTTRVRPERYFDRNVCRLTYEIRRSDASAVTSEEHLVRYFFIPELDMALNSVGLELVETLDGNDWSKPLNGPRWSAALVAKRGAS